MDSVSEVDKEGLDNFLGYQLLPFLSDKGAPADNISINAAGHTHLTEKELDDLFSNAFEEFDGERIRRSRWRKDQIRWKYFN